MAWPTSRRHTIQEVVNHILFAHAMHTRPTLPVAIQQMTFHFDVQRCKHIPTPALCPPFGVQEDVDRLRRMLKAEREVRVEDETVGGQQDNLMLKLRQEEKERQKAVAAQKPSTAQQKQADAIKAAPAAATAADGSGAADGWVEQPGG